MQDPWVVVKKFVSFPSNFFTQPFQYFQLVNMVDCLSSWYKFIMKNPIKIKSANFIIRPRIVIYFLAVGQYLLLKYPNRTITILLFPLKLLYGDLSLQAWFILRTLGSFWTHVHLECRKTSISWNLFLKFYVDCSLGLHGGCSLWLQIQESRACKLRIFNSKYWERCIETNFIT